MSDIKVSVIVPIYNVEKELMRCVESLINQTLKDIEILLVDDGSPDNSPKICDDYTLKDNRIRVFHKENGGLSDARNFGLKEASGKYILFVDSDDYINRDACEILYLNANEGDLEVAVGDAIRIENNAKDYMLHADISINKLMTGKDFLKEQLKHHSMHMAAWLNLYRREFIIKNNLFFKKGIYHEDEQWTPRVFLKADRVKYVKIAFYNYIKREISITKKNNKSENAIDLINTCYELEKKYQNIEDKKLRVLLNDYLVMLFLHAIHLGNLYNKKYSILYSKKFLIGKPKTIKNKFKAWLFIFNKHIYKQVNCLAKYLENK